MECMFSTDERPTDTAVTVEMYPDALLRLLVLRMRSAHDPAPELPAVAHWSGPVTRVDEFEGSMWRSHWDEQLAWLQHTDRVREPFKQPIWPSALPSIDDDLISTWRSTLPRVERGTPLEERPSRRYWHARTAAPALPEQLIVLPLEGHWSERLSARSALVSTALFFSGGAPDLGLLTA